MYKHPMFGVKMAATIAVIIALIIINSCVAKASVGIFTGKPEIYNSENIRLLSHLIYAENTTDKKSQMYIGSVVLNRVNHKNFPNTLKKVIYQKNQYGVVKNGAIKWKPSKQAIRVAKRLLRYGSVLPRNVVYQAEFKQGKGVYIKRGNTYFCYR